MTKDVYSASPLDITVRAPKRILKNRGITNRQWKAQKRAELKLIIRAFEDYRIGCAYCPGKDGEIGVLEETLRKLEHLHSVKVWGR